MAAATGAHVFRFAKEQPDDAMLSNMATADKFPDELFREFMEIVLTILTQPTKAARMLDQMEGFAEENGANVSATKNVFKAMLTFFRSAHKSNLTPAHVLEDLTNMGLSEGKAKALAKAYKRNIVAMSRVAIGRSLMVNQLEDMQWKFGVTAGSSEIRSTGQAFLQLNMTLNKGSKSEDVCMELTLEQFYTFLNEMEKAKAGLEYLS